MGGKKTKKKKRKEKKEREKKKKQSLETIGKYPHFHSWYWVVGWGLKNGECQTLFLKLYLNKPFWSKYFYNLKKKGE